MLNTTFITCPEYWILSRTDYYIIRAFIHRMLMQVRPMTCPARNDIHKPYYNNPSISPWKETKLPQTILVLASTCFNWVRKLIEASSSQIDISLFIPRNKSRKAIATKLTALLTRIMFTLLTVFLHKYLNWWCISREYQLHRCIVVVDLGNGWKKTQ